VAIAFHNARDRMITLAPLTLAEDPRIVATILVHELRHSINLEDVAKGDLAPDCLHLEARAFEDQEWPMVPSTCAP